MLVLTRKPNQSIMVGDDVVITILEVRGDKVRVGIEAPRDVIVHRKEVYEAIRQNVEAAESAKRVTLDDIEEILKKRLSGKDE